jgi:threonine aldolase
MNENKMIVDLRSDTVTRPTPGMLDAMYNARVGDDVFEEDETVNALQERPQTSLAWKMPFFVLRAL